MIERPTMPRIPNKDTDRAAYHRYCRDRGILDDLISRQRTVDAVADQESDPTRRGHFIRALGLLEDAIDAWRSGCDLPYARRE